MPHQSRFLTPEQFLLTLMAEIAIMAVLATMLVRFNWFRKILLTEKRDWPERLVFAGSLGLPLTFGVLARLVLESWGIRSSSDIGDVVFTLVDLELLMSQPTDSRDEFIGVFDFDQAFERDYPWCAQLV